jgi:hypothetical protein
MRPKERNSNRRAVVSCAGNKDTCVGHAPNERKTEEDKVTT